MIYDEFTYNIYNLAKLNVAFIIIYEHTITLFLNK